MSQLIKVYLANVHASGVILALVVLALVYVNLAVLSGVSNITDAGVGLRAVLETGAMVEAGLEAAGVVGNVTDGASPAGGALAGESNVQCNAPSFILARKGETVIDTEHFKPRVLVCILKTKAVMYGVRGLEGSGGLVWALEAVVCASFVLEVGRWAGEAGVEAGV